MTEERLFDLALSAPESERAALLDRECAGNSELRHRLEALLEAHGQTCSFLDRPPGAANAADFAPAEQEHTLPPRTSAETPGAQIGPYKLRELIGEGGMGEVWMAEQREPVRRMVALKLIKAGMDSALVIARFEAERQALALMDHPNIAKVLDGGTSAGRPYFVMELVKGIPITDYCDQHRLTPAQRLELFIQVCRALQHAHQKGIIHRDLKPSNVLVAPFDGEPVVKVIDFGVAKAIGQQLTERTMFTGFGAMIGTLQYMSPEQAELTNHDIDTRSDIYSLGVVLYELLTGTTPLDRNRLRGAALAAMLMAIQEEEPPKPSTRLNESKDSLPSISAHRHMEPARLTKLVRGDLDWIVMKALSKDRARRYETANGLARDIERYLADEPVEAGPPSARYRLRKFVRRNQGSVIAASLILLSLIGGIVGTSLAMRRAVAERTEKEQALDQVSAEQRLTAAERDRANDEKQIALAVRDFLQYKLLDLADTGAQANALLAAGRSSAEAKLDPRISELLDRAAAALTPDKIDSQFPNQPLVQAAILQTIGDTYRGIGKYSKAIAHLERARDLQIAKLGADDPYTLATLNNLALTYRVSGKLPEAIRLLEQVRDASVAKLGADHPDTLTTLRNLGVAYYDAGELPEAVKLFEQVRDASVAKLGADHPGTLSSLQDLAVAYKTAGKLSEAIRLFEQVREAQLSKFGADHPNTLATLNNLAVAYQDSGNLPEAIRHFEQVRDVCVAKFGADHPYTLTTLNNLAVAYQDSGKLPEAIRLFEQVRDAHVAKLGADHPGTLTALNNLARGYRTAGKLPEAIQLSEQAAIGIEKRSFQHVNAGRIIGNTAACYEQMKDFEKAESWRRKWLTVVKNKSVEESSAYAAELAGLGWDLIQQKKYGEAEASLRESLAIREKKEPESWTTFNTKSLLGEALAGEAKLADAEPWLTQGYEGIKQHQEKIPPAVRTQHLTEALESLIHLYNDWGKPEESAKWKKELEEMKKAAEKPDKP